MKKAETTCDIRVTLLLLWRSALFCIVYYFEIIFECVFCSFLVVIFMFTND